MNAKRNFYTAAIMLMLTAKGIAQDNIKNDTIYVKNFHNTFAKPPAFYDDKTKSIHILNFVLDSVAYKNWHDSLPDNHELKAVGILQMRRALNKINDYAPIALKHERRHEKNKVIQKLGWNFSQIETSNIHDEISAIIDEMFGCVEQFNQTGSLEKSFSMYLIPDMPVEKSESFIGGVFILADYLAKHGGTYCPALLDALIISALNHTEYAFTKQDKQYVSMIPKIIQFELKKLYGLYKFILNGGGAMPAEIISYQSALNQYYSFDEICGRNIFDIVSASQKKRMEQIVQKLQNNPEFIKNSSWAKEAYSTEIDSFSRLLAVKFQNLAER
ncbi:MAG: hypothetical protein LBJ18_01530 [Rickettsiales bacterium]|jgi:hypothetical protein|nr:hypothetical protein [Rickettsiales bacterium]